jgi:hypothetical protein
MAPFDSISYAAPIPRPAQITDTVQVYFSATDISFGNVIYPKTAPQQVFLLRGDGILLNTDQKVIAPPTAFALAQNLPNPFGGLNAASTKIAFELPQPSAVQFRIFNVLGQRVRTLFDGNLPLGRHEMIWDGTDDAGRPVVAGVYFYEVATSLGRGRQKLLLLR